MRVLVADPSAFTPPYDHALCTALAARGAQVELVTSRFDHGDAPAPEGYERADSFYRLRGPGPLRVPLKLAQHVPGMLGVRRRARDFDIVHFQWLAVQPVDARLLPRDRPVVLTAHDVLPRAPRPGQLRGTRRALEAVDAVVVHSEHGRDRLRELGVEATVIPHPAFTALRDVAPRLPPELAGAPEGPVTLFFGLVRPYKGLDVLLEAWRGIDEGELWIVGRARGVALPADLPPRVRVVSRFVTDAEAAAVFGRARVAVLPYRDSEGSGVLATAQGLGVPVILSDVGAFGEVEGARLVAPGDASALREALRDPPTAPPASSSWDDAAARHLALYERLAR